MTKQALEGLKVVDFSWLATGPIVTKYLADHGAMVVRIESVTRPDGVRVMRPYKDNIPGINRSGAFTSFNSNKYGMALNLKKPQAVEIAQRLVAWADVVVESFTPRAMKRWGLDYESVGKIKPDIIYVSTCLFGQTGPRANTVGHGGTLTAAAGLNLVTGWPDREPCYPYGAYTDLIAPQFITAALLAALDYRRRTGKGQHLDSAQYESAIQFIAPLILHYELNGEEIPRAGNRSSGAAPHGVYRCKGEDRWCAMAVSDDEQWRAFGKVLGELPWTREPRFATLKGRMENADEIDKLVEAWTVNLDAEKVMTLLQEQGVPAGVVRDAEGLHNDPQLRHRNHFIVLNHAEIGPSFYEAPSFRLSETPTLLERGSPCLGEHTAYVCRHILGMPDEEFVKLLGEGVFE